MSAPTLADAAYRYGDAIRAAGTSLVSLSETDAATPAALRKCIAEAERAIAGLRAALQQAACRLCGGQGRRVHCDAYHAHTSACEIDCTCRGGAA